MKEYSNDWPLRTHHRTPTHRIIACAALRTETIMSEMKPVTVERAREALEDMDDYARMDAGVDAKGPREVLERFIAEHERVMDKLQELSASLKADAAALRRDGVWRCCGSTYEYAAAHIDAILEA